MGLDMYLNRYPRYKDYKPINYRAFEEWSEWKQKGKDKEYTFHGWCGYDEDDLPAKEDFPFFESLISTKYWAWDEEHRYPNEMIHDPVGYWRKANAVHLWFVNRVQGGVDDCEYHDEVTKKDLEDLRDICKEVLESAVLMNGKVENGKHLVDGKWVSNFEDGKVVVNPEVCARLLPTTSGFFFGGTDYDEWYIEDIKYTYELCCRVLEETDFEKQMIYYCSSW